jgi:hypothetical protein
LGLSLLEMQQSFPQSLRVEAMQQLQQLLPGLRAMKVTLAQNAQTSHWCGMVSV